MDEGEASTGAAWVVATRTWLISSKDKRSDPSDDGLGDPETRRGSVTEMACFMVNWGEDAIRQGPQTTRHMFAGVQAIMSPPVRVA